MYDRARIGSGLAGRPRTHARSDPKGCVNWGNDMHSEHVSTDVFFWTSLEGQRPDCILKASVQELPGPDMVWVRVDKWDYPPVTLM